MKTCSWEKINDFQNLTEFNRFVNWMGDETKTGVLTGLVFGFDVGTGFIGYAKQKSTNFKGVRMPTFDSFFLKDYALEKSKSACARNHQE